MTEVAQPKRMAVIGAGAAGLCSAKHLLAQGFAVTIYEIGTKIGGLWVYENDNGLSPTYRSLHLNSEKRVTAYRDFPFPDESTYYAHHSEVHAYLEAYADHSDLRRRIRFNSKVVALQSTKGGGWRVRLEDGTEEKFDGVVVATGHQGSPSHPPFAKKFAGEYLHSHAYRHPEPFRGKRVVVIGAGNSAVDIAADICTVTAATTLSVRSPVLIMPRTLFGKPLSRFLARIEKPYVPWPVRRWVREFVVRMVSGPMEQWGFVTPKTRTHPTSHPNLMAHFVWGRVKGKPGIADIQGQQIRFEDGSTETFDTMIAATGYNVDLPFLPPQVRVVDGHRLNLYRRIAVPGWSDLYFVGFFNVSGGGNIRLMDYQAEWIAAIASGEVMPPDAAEMQKDIEREHEEMTRMYPDRPRYGLELDSRKYGVELAKEMERGRERARRHGDSRPSPHVRKEIRELAHEHFPTAE
jgi:cation diffusion facilitator CzcD-associated flavoprotein CzcO